MGTRVVVVVVAAAIVVAGVVAAVAVMVAGVAAAAVVQEVRSFVELPLAAHLRYPSPAGQTSDDLR